MLVDGLQILLIETLSLIWAWLEESAVVVDFLYHLVSSFASSRLLFSEDRVKLPQSFPRSVS